MEKGKGSRMKEMNWREAINLPSLTLAYIGDGIYEIAVRRYLLESGIKKADEIHKEAVKYVKATFQSGFYHLLLDKLSEAELAVMKRGRNAKTGHQPKSSGVAEYHNATGVEALMGALWLSGDQERLDTIFDLLFDLMQKDKGEIR
jgi:ribonuclease-3 family protein